MRRKIIGLYYCLLHSDIADDILAIDFLEESTENLPRVQKRVLLVEVILTSVAARNSKNKNR